MLEVCTESVITSFLKQCGSPVLYVSSATDGREYIQCIPDLDGCFVCDLADGKTAVSPYAPFVHLLSQIKIPQQTVKNVVYPLHRDTFCGYFDTGTAYPRQDVIIPSELDYEKQRMQENIISLFSTSCNHPVVILNAQRLSPDAVRLIEAVEAKKIRQKIIICFNESESVENTETGITYRQIRFNHNFYTLPDVKKQGKSKSVNGDFTYAPQKMADYLLSLSMNDLSSVVWNNRYFLSLQQASKIIDIVIPHIKDITPNTMDARVLYLEAGIISFYLGDTDKALFYFETITGMSSDDYAGKRALYFTAQVLLQKNDFSSANKYALMLYQKTEGNDDYSLNTLAASIHHIIRVSVSRNVTIEDYRRFQDLLETKNLPNNTINTLLFIPYHITQSAEITAHISKTIDDVIRIAESLNNEIAMSAAYHWKGLILSAAGNKGEAFVWYTKSNEIRDRIGDIQYVIKMRNGLSYEKLISGDYTQAFNLINSSLPRVYEINDYTETILTLYNLGRILFFGRNFKTALDVFSQTRNMMSLFKLKELLYFTIEDLSLFTALIQCINQDTMQARFTYERLVNSNSVVSANGEPLLDLLGAFIDSAGHNVQESIGKFEKFRQHIYSDCPTLKNYLPFACFEYAVIADRQGFKQEAEQLYEKGLAYAVQNEMPVYSSPEFPTEISVYRNYSVFFEPLKLDFVHIEERAEKETLVNNLHKQIRDTRFLNKILDLSANYPVKEEFVHHCALTVCEYFLCDSIYIAEKNGSEWLPLTSYSNSGLPLDIIPDCDEIVNSYRGMEFFYYDESKKIVFCNMEKFEFTGAAMIVMNENEQLSGEDLNLLRLALSSLQSQLTMFKQNENLLKLSSTDQLTALKNRHALEDKLDKDSEMIRRYFRRDKVVFQMSVTFIDLDNFKYYNDTFGHEAGDFMIASFGRLLTQQYRRIDFVARFGGDEFIVLMPATQPEGALLAANRLREALQKEHHFIPQLERMLCRRVDIPESRYLGFCAGISSNSEQDDIDNLEEVINRADKALYYAKYSGKSQAVLWSDIANCDLLKMEQIDAQ